MTHVALYLRKSRADLDAEARGEGETLAKHRRELLALADRQGCVIDAIHEELVSGERIVDRPEMQRLLHDVTAGRYQAVLVMDIDRLGRGNKIDQGLIQEAFQASHTLIMTPQRTYNPLDDTDEELLDFQSFMAHRELKIITRRLQRGRRASVKEGKSISKKPPYGYRREHHVLVPDPDTAPIVAQMFAWAADGWGLVRICHELEDRGIPSPTGNRRWDHCSVRNILTNPAYIGHLRWDYIRRRKQDGVLKYTIQPREMQTWKENAHAPIVEQGIWDRAQARRRRQPPLGKARALRNPLAGLIFCAACGRPMRRVAKCDAQAALQCRTHRCPTRGTIVSYVERSVLRSLDDMAPQLRRTAREGSQVPAMVSGLMRDVQTLQRAILTAEEQRAKLHDLLEQGLYDADTFVARNQVLGERLDALRAKLSAQEERLARARAPALTEAALLAVLAAYREAHTAQEKNGLLHGLVERIEYRRDPGWTEPGRFEVSIQLRM